MTELKEKVKFFFYLVKSYWQDGSKDLDLFFQRADSKCQRLWTNFGKDLEGNHFYSMPPFRLNDVIYSHRSH